MSGVLQNSSACRKGWPQYCFDFSAGALMRERLRSGLGGWESTYFIAFCAHSPAVSHSIARACSSTESLVACPRQQHVWQAGRHAGKLCVLALAPTYCCLGVHACIIMCLGRLRAAGKGVRAQRRPPPPELMFCVLFDAGRESARGLYVMNQF